MKNRITAFLLILLIPFSVLFAEQVSTKVSLDYTTKNLETIKVKFTSGGVAATEQLPGGPSNFKKYDTLADLSYQTAAGATVIGLELKPEASGNKFEAASTHDCFISWQAYTKKSAIIYMSVDKPLTAETGETINWKVYMDPETQNMQVADSSIEGSKIKVAVTIPDYQGVTGSRKFHVVTESLWDKPFKSYKANIVATIEVVV